MTINLPPEFVSFHALVEKIESKTSGSRFALQIGAMDGIKFDLLHPHLINGKWHGLLVEPVPDMFEKLRLTYKGCSQLQFANCAVAGHNGSLTLRRIDPAAVEKGLIPEEALGITSSFADRSLLSHPKFSQAYPEVAKNYIRELEIPCCPLNDLLERYDVKAIDLAVIDTEGADWLIIRQLDLKRFAPSVICMEYTDLPENEVQDCYNHFSSYGYRAALCAEDHQNLIFSAFRSLNEHNPPFA